MKTTVAALVLLFSNQLVKGAVVNYDDSKGHFPSHIIKLKSANINNMTGFEPTSFIRKHFATFREIETTLQGKFDVSGQVNGGIKATKEPAELQNVNIGNEFRAVFGTFDPSFISYLSKLNDVEYIEPNQVYKAAIMPTSHQPQPYEKKNHQKRTMMTQENVPSWGLARINTRELDDLSTYSVDDEAGNNIHVYVLDSGVSTSHPDFEGRANMEANFITYEDEKDHAGHGTHVAGTIGGSTFGVAKRVLIHGVKILDRNGDGTTSALVQAISHITQNAPHGRSIINLSLTGPRSETIDNALSMAVRQHGIPVFASAGNSGDDACNYSPAANPDVFTVGASDNHDGIPPFSSYGQCVRIYAPGAGITSSWVDNKSQIMDGTSMANPHVAGIAALLMSQFTFNSPFELYDAITSLATHDVLQSPIDEESSKLLAYYGPDHSD